MKKVVVLVTLLLAPAAFGAVVGLDKNAVTAAPGTQFSVTYNVVSLDAGEKMFGIDIYPMAQAVVEDPGTFLGSPLTLVGRTTLMTTDYSATIPDASAAGQPLDGSVNLGSVITDAKYTAGGSTLSGPFMTFTFSVNADAPAKFFMVFNGGTTNMAGAQLAAMPAVEVTTPEPVSALLLGLGSLFFARRRRA